MPSSNHPLFPFLVLLLIFSACAHQAEEADLIIHNATVYTLDENFSTAEAIAIKDGIILEVGPERQILNKYRTSNKVDAAKRPIYPGFIDAHCHFLGYGLGLRNADLVGTTSFEEVLARMEQHAASHPDGWLIGRGWDQNDWEEKEFPTRIQLDELFPDRPVYLDRIDGHAALLNAKALEMCGITTESALGREDILLRDSIEPSGVVLDNARGMVRDIIPEPGVKEKTEALLAAEENCFAVGLTTVDDAGLERDEIELIQALQEEGNLKMRVYAMVSDTPDDLDYYTENGPYYSDRLQVSAFKFYADGALGSRGACLIDPYADVPGMQQYGMLLDSVDHFREAARRLYDAGFQMNTHCIGDSANRTLLDIYAEVLGGQNDRRWRIEHAQVVHKADIAKFAEHSIIPSIQPTHATSDMYWAEQRLGRNRIRRAYAYQELRNQLGFVALGTDFPVEGISPLATFYAAVVRKDKEQFPEGGFQPENALTREEALRGMTCWAAMANHQDTLRGSLRAGMQADLIMLSSDLMHCAEDQILDVRVLRTILAGEEVYSAE